MNLVTGSTGIVGIRIMFDLLSANKKVKAFHRKGSNKEEVRKAFEFYSEQSGRRLFEQIIWFEGDLFDISSIECALEECDYVYHCAALVSFHHKDHDEMYNVNQIGTENMINGSLSSGIKLFCHISSIASIGREREGEIISENTEWSNSHYNSYYALTKHAAEQEVWRGMEEGLPAVILNPGIIFGSGTYGKSSSSLFSEVNKGLKFYTNGGGSFVDVRDVAKIAIEAVNRNISNERFILVSEGRSLRSIFNLIAKHLKKKGPNILANKVFLKLGWRLFYLKDLIFGSKSPLTKESAKAANSTFLYNSEKVKKTFKMDFISCEKSIQFFSQYYQRV